MKTHLVEVLISVGQDGSDTESGEAMFTGEYVLRAFAVDGTLLHEAVGVALGLDTPTSDYARLLTLTIALERLHSKLCGGKAWYTLRVVQSSKNVDGWLARGWKRKAEQVKEFAGEVDRLLVPFSHREFIKLSREELNARMSTGEGVMPRA